MDLRLAVVSGLFVSISSNSIVAARNCSAIACRAALLNTPSALLAMGLPLRGSGIRAGAEVLHASSRLAFMVLHFMAKKSNKVVPKKRRGRPATGRDPVTAIRLSKELRETVDRWAASQDDEPSRSEAIRRLVLIALGLGLKAKGK